MIIQHDTNPTGAGWVTPLPLTLLPLATYAQILGINPVHFQGAFSDSVWPLDNNNCEDVWPRYSWQWADSVSHHDLAVAIQSAERSIADYMKTWPAPMWIEDEIIDYPKTMYGYNSMYAADWKHKTVRTEWGNVLAFGVRQLTTVELGATVTYTDEDGDGFFETATITVTPAAGTDIRNVKVFFAGAEGSPYWEVRPIKRRPNAPNLDIVVDSWLLIRPEVQGRNTQWSNFQAIQLNNTTNLATTVDVYVETIDESENATMYWGNGCEYCLGFPNLNSPGCEFCGYITQTACATVTDAENGYARLLPASYDDTTDTWTTETQSAAGQPDFVKASYYAGLVGNNFNRWYKGSTIDEQMARAIVWMATARLDRPFCSCGNVASLTETLRRDISSSADDSALLVNFDLLGNPFGTKVGEVRAWQYFSKLNRDALIIASVV